MERWPPCGSNQALFTVATGETEGIFNESPKPHSLIIQIHSIQGATLALQTMVYYKVVQEDKET